MAKQMKRESKDALDGAIFKDQKRYLPEFPFRFRKKHTIFSADAVLYQPIDGSALEITGGGCDPLTGAEKKVLQDAFGTLNLAKIRIELLKCYTQAEIHDFRWTDLLKHAATLADDFKVLDGKNKISKESQALAALVEHPEWDITQIAKYAGCNRSSLYAMKKFMAAQNALKQGKNEIAKGQKHNSSIEAFED